MGDQASGLRPNDPRWLGRYRVLGRLGAGGMGTVFLAEVSGEQVAIKLIHPAYSANSTYRRRFVNEVTAARAVRSPYTATVLDAELVSDPLYIVTDVIRGSSLGELVAPGHGLAAGRLIALAKDTARALRDMHGQNVVHRDLKPSNVMVGADRTRLIDFGIAAHIDDIGDLTSTGKVVGSLPYLAPELLRADGRASPASDVFSWGCMIYFAATGRTPFAGNAGILVEKILNETADVRAVPGAVRELVARALSKWPQARPTAGEILDELDSIGAPVVLCGEERRSYTAQLRDHLKDAGFSVRMSSVPETLAGSSVLVVMVSDEPSTAVADMRLAAQRLGIAVLPVLVGAHNHPDAFLDARANALPGPEHIRRLRELTRNRHTGSVGSVGSVGSAGAARTEDTKGPVDSGVEAIRLALVRGDLVAADHLTTAALLAAAGRSQAGWIGRDDADRLGTVFLRDCARVWHEETAKRHGFVAQLSLCPGDLDRDMVDLVKLFGWDNPHAISPDYHRWVSDNGHHPGFFPTLRTAVRPTQWYDRWSMTVSAVHRRIRRESLYA